MDASEILDSGEFKALVIFNVLFFVMGCVLMYWNCQLYAYRHHLFVHNRFYPITALIGTLFTSFMCIDRPLSNWCRLLRLECDSDTLHSNAYQIPWLCLNVEWSLSTEVIGILVMARLFAISYDIRWSLASADNKWAQHIDSSFGQSDFFVRYRNTFGNIVWMLTRVWLPLYCIKVTSSWILNWAVDYYTAGAILDMTFAAMIGIIYATVWCKTPPYMDVSYRREEMRYISYGCLVFFVSTVMHTILTPVITYYGTLIADTAMVGSFLFMAYIGSVKIIDRIHESEANNGTLNSGDGNDSTNPFSGRLMRALSQSIGSPRASPESPQSSVVSNQSQTRIKLTDIIGNTTCFSMFMTHLLLEFCSENLLCITELRQFQMWCVDNIDDISYDAKVTLPIDESFPQSEIVYNSDNSIDDKIQLLIEKYIKTGATFEVNLSYSDRSFVGQIAHLDINGKCHLFDRIIDSLLFLLGGSYVRWKLTPAFTDLESLDIIHNKARV